MSSCATRGPSLIARTPVRAPRERRAPSHLTDSLVGVEGRVTGREDVGLVRVVPRRKPLDIHHCLPIGTATVVPADQEKDGGADVIDEVDRVPIAHQLGNVTRFSSEQRSIVGLEQRRKVLVPGLVISHRNTRDAATPQVRMLSELEERHVTAPRVARDHCALRICDPALDQILQARVHVLELRAADVPDERVTPLAPVSSRAAVVDHRRLRIPRRRTPVPPAASGRCRARSGLRARTSARGTGLLSRPA